MTTGASYVRYSFSSQAVTCSWILPKKEKKAKALRNIRLLEQELKNSGWDAEAHATQLDQNIEKQDTDAEQKSKITDAKKEQQIPYL